MSTPIRVVHLPRNLRAVRLALAVLALLFVFSGVLAFFAAQKNSERALATIEHFDPAHALSLKNDAMRPVREVRQILRREPYEVLGLHLGLALAMVGLFVWAPRAPRAAMLTAVSVFFAVQAVNAILDPGTLTQGVPIKIVAILLLGRAMWAAFTSRSELKTR